MSLVLKNQTYLADAIFRGKSILLTIRRHFQNIWTRPQQFPTTQERLADMPMVAISSSPLWNPADTEQNEILTIGKVHNLRAAVRRLNGVEIPANTPFSFWAHLGRPSPNKGYVLGREIREGCFVPTIAGGLCQLSNALYDAALQAGYTILERHRHSQIIPGSLAERDRDATVKWNYIDLRFSASHAFRVETELTASELIVRFKSEPQLSAIPHQGVLPLRVSSRLNDCYSCGNGTCFRHPTTPKTGVLSPTSIGSTTYVLDEHWPEYIAYVTNTVRTDDVILAPSYNKESYSKDWQALSTIEGIVPRFKTIGSSYHPWIRTLRVRLVKNSEGNVFATNIRLSQKDAYATARQIPWNSTHLVVSQNFLPFLWEIGVLGGRTFDVLMTRLPFERLHARLDMAYAKYPMSETLRDFRAPQKLIDLENAALTHARHVITPHNDIAAMFAHKVIFLPWSVPAPERRATMSRQKILFPASALGRKGAYEMRRLARELSLSFLTMGRILEEPNFWDGLSTTNAAEDPLAGVGLVIYPTYVEHQPRLLLRALTGGARVITTTACGLARTDHLTVVPIGDYDALRAAVETELTLMRHD